MNKTLNFKFRAFSVLLVLAACVKSPPGKFGELVSIRPPTFGGATDKNFTTSSFTFTLTGECDGGSLGLEYSYDQTNWQELDPGCVDNGFSILLNPVSTLDVYVRAKTKIGYTTNSHAWVRVLHPPTNPQVAFVAAGNATEEFQHGTQYGLELNSTSETLSNGIMTIKNSLVDIIYDQ